LSFAGFARGQLSGHDIDAVTGGSVGLTQVSKATTKAMSSARIVE
jgi:hypothetical protein